MFHFKDNKVGINTTPFSTLDINGNTKINGTLNINGNLLQNGILFSSDGNGGGSSQWSDGVDLSIYYNSGNVGIGTNNPLQKLDVSGNALISGNISGANISASGNISGANISVSGDISTSNINFSGNLYQNGVLFTGTGGGGGSSQWSDGSNNIIFYNSGNVGVGTSNPSKELDISGNIFVSKNVSCANINLSGNIYRNNLLLSTINTSFIRRAFIVTGTQISFDLSYNGIIYSEETEIEVYVNGYKLAYVNSTTKDYTLTVINDVVNNFTTFRVTLDEGALDGDIVDIVVLPGLKFTTETPSVYQSGDLLGTVLDPINGGSIDINISLVPNALIELSNDNNPLVINFLPGSFDTSYVGKKGRIYIRERCVSGRNITIDNRLYFNSSFGMGKTSDASTNPVIDILEYEIIKSDLVVGKYNKHINEYVWDDVNKRLGIGTDIPLQQLDVSGNALIRGNISGANISASGNISGANISASGDISASNINFSGNLYQNGVLFTGGGGSSQWSDGSNNTIYYNTGNIGIGTTIPTNKLDVRGNMDISGNIIPKHNITYDLGSSDYRWRDLYLSGNTIDLGGTRIKRNSNGKGIKVIDDIGNTVNSTFKDVLVDGNIGIGTNTPLQQLDVSGNSLFRGNVGIGNDTPIVALDVSGNVFIRGNVGIGSNNPSQTLDVSGNVKAASFLGDGSQLTNLQIPITLGGALSDETTALTTENSLTLFSPYDINIRSTKLPKFTINTAATATITFDVTVNGSTIYNTKPTITTGNKISSGGVLITNPTTVLEDTVIIASVNSIGSGGTGAKVYIYSL